MRTNFRLSELVLNRRNPRRVKPEWDAHRRLVASIRAYGLLQPLVDWPAVDDPKSFRVIAGRRRDGFQSSDPTGTVERGRVFIPDLLA